MKRISCLGIIVLLLVLTGIDVYGFTDLVDNGPYNEAILEFQERGLTKGYPDGTFRPLDPIKRSEFVTLVNRAFEYEAVESELSFVDVSAGDWYGNQLKVAVNRGYIQGYPDKTFRPNRVITRQEVAVVLNRIVQYEPKEYVELPETFQLWSRDSIMAMISNDVMPLHGDVFDSDVAITREEVVVALLNILHQSEALEADMDEEALEQDVMETVIDDPGLVGGGEFIIPDDGSQPTADVIYAMNATIDGLGDVLIGRTSFARVLEEQQLDIIRDIQNNMQAYLADYTYDYDRQAQVVKNEMSAMSQSEQDEIEKAIRASVSINYLNLLKDFFYSGE